MHSFVKAVSGFILLAFASLAWAEPLDINTATIEQLDTVMAGIGKAKAEAIVQDREKNGKFKSVDDLERVKGIGPAIIKKNRDKIMVVPEETPPQAGQPTQPVQPETSVKAK